MYVLLAASALVWGWVFVKIFGAFFKSEDDNFIKIKKKTTEVNYSTQSDTFELLANYPDPFLKKARGVLMYNNVDYRSNVNLTSISSKKVAVVASKKSKKEEPVINWEFIKYKGRITRQSTGKILSLVTINGNDYSLEEGKIVHNVTLLKITHDSIQVSFEGVKKYIIRNKN
jgi:hypothetical protein